MMPGRITILAGAHVVHHDVVERRDICFADGAVVGAADDTAFRMDLSGHLIFPGLINAHDHLQLNGVPRLEHSAKFANSYEWIAAMTEHRRRPDVEDAVRVPLAERLWHGALKNALSGATTVAHHDPFDLSISDAEFPVRVPSDMGWAHSLGLGGADDQSPEPYGPDVRASFAATPAHRPWVIHLAEGTDERAASELGVLDALGALAANSVLVHGVGLTGGDVRLIVERGAAVVWCPSSNLSMFGATLDPRGLIAAGRLALGTDSTLTGSRGLLDELRIASACAELSGVEAVRLVTADGSRVLREARAGNLAVGSYADCVILPDAADPHAALVRARRSALRAVIRGGRPLVADPDFAPLFEACDVPATSIVLDGRPKLIASSMLRYGDRLPA
ncbi:MAG: amidohydrolase family protein [Gemmatimonadaceae bacterium]